MGKRILVIGYNYHPELTGIGKYNGEMVWWLAKKGYDCTVITSYPYYPYWQVQEPYQKDRFWYKTEKHEFDSGGKIKVYRCPMYVPAEPSGLKRILLDFSFLITAFIKLLQLLVGKKVDFVLTVAPSFHFGLLGLLYKKLRKAKFLYHIQDLQIEAARDLQMIKSAGLINALLKIERYFYQQADVISTISEGMICLIKKKALREVFLFPNWSDNSLFFPVVDKNKLKQEFGFAITDKVILYSGAIGEKQGLEVIIQAAKAFQQQKELKFLICGSGPYKQRLQELAIKLNLDNVIFFPLQPLEKLNHFLNLADVHLVIQRSYATDLVMPSKLTTILAVGGLALITVNKGSSLYRLVEHFKMGLLVDAENQRALNEGISRALNARYDEITSNARSYAEQYLSIDLIMQSFENLVLQHT